MNRRRPSRTFLRVFSAFYLIFAMTLTGLVIGSIVADDRASEASAVVREVEHRGARTLVAIQFTTSRGETCDAHFRVAVKANRTVTTGDRIRVHYAESDPCFGVQEVGDRSAWFIALIGVVLLTVAAILAYVVWRRPRPPLPLRYAGMP
ncbi:DUF3592 domain-containing protein [Micromonospora sp. NPDC049107]|uniref:DUF3592 domain-containing protein n=1 Tax=Micromonospora sp. NPDC049107 TaxID=3154349 RepID=UPI0033F41A78